ncbi:MAG: GH116 family glycosyl hydrolase, partial [Chloroflexi bacterium]|nr:GH116 family glycosyl hydrolase [Chloroflexota bacterium]
AVADDALGRFDSLLARVLAWQNAIYTSDLPNWLRDALVQGLYSLSKNTVWIAKTRKDEWWDDIGWFTHNESHTGCPITETMVCRMHGHMPALFFYPELERTALEAFRHFQILDGEIPFSYGMESSMRDPRYHCQHPLNSGQYAQMIYRLYLRTGDRDLLAYFYDSAKRAIRYQHSLDDDGDGLVNDQAHVQPTELWPANQFYDIWPWWGTSAYVAGTWLATLSCGEAMAIAMDDDAFAIECADWLKRGKAAYQAKLWNGEYYRLWHDPANTSGEGPDCDVSLGNQLMAQWCVKITGIADILPAEQVQSALGAVKRLNMGATRHGLVNGVNPDGSRYISKSDSDADQVVEILPNNDHATQVFVGENLCAAMNFIYHGQRETGLEIARRIYEAVALTSRTPWKQHCLIDADTGLPVWGEDYYSNMVIWALPMACANQSIAEFMRSELIREMTST